jgi:hypothetical protein
MTDEDADNLTPEETGFHNYMNWEPRKPLYDAFAALSDAQIGQLAAGRSVTVGLSGKGNEERSALLAGLLRTSENADQFIDATSIEFTGERRLAAERLYPSDAFFLKIRGDNGSDFTDVCYLTPEATARRPAKLDRPTLAETLKAFKPTQQLAAKQADRLDLIVKLDYKSAIGFHSGMRAVAHATGIPIVSDYYTSGYGSVNARDQRARDLIVSLAAKYGHSWAWDGNALVFRTDNWPAMMLQELPNSTLAAMKDTGGGGKLNLAQSLIASDLSVEQSTCLPKYGYSAPWIADDKLTAAFRFLSRLSCASFKQTGTAQGLSVALIPRYARAAYADLVGACFGVGAATPPIEAVRATATALPASPDGGTSSQFTFEFVFGSSAERRRDALTCTLGPAGPPKSPPASMPAE